MSKDGSEIPEADRVEGLPHPRETVDLLGQKNAEDTFLAAFNEDRLHHAWLVTGPSGIGKSTLAWRIARFLLQQPVSDGGLFGDTPQQPENLDVDLNTPLARRISVLSEPSLRILRRPWDPKAKKLKTVITVDEVRSLKSMFELSRPDGGRRIVIVDSADEMNANASNALLKLLEEPPDHTVFLLISHLPSRLLPTIRSRCRTLPCATLSTQTIAELLQRADPGIGTQEAEAISSLSQGSFGTAWRLHQLDGAALRSEILAFLAALPGFDRSRGSKLASELSVRDAEDRRELFLQMTDQILCELAVFGVTGQGLAADSAPLQHLSSSPRAGQLWAEGQQGLTARVRRGLGVNLDPHSLLLDMMLRIDTLAADSATH